LRGLFAAGGDSNEIVLWKRVADTYNPAAARAAIRAAGASSHGIAAVGDFKREVKMEKIGEFRAATGTTTTAEFSFDNKLMIVASHDAKARIFDVRTRSVVHTLEHTADVRGATFSPDAKQAATAEFKTNAYVWDVASGAKLFTLNCGCIVFDVAHLGSHEGAFNTILTCDINGQLVKWHVPLSSSQSASSNNINMGVAFAAKVESGGALYNMHASLASGCVAVASGTGNSYLYNIKDFEPVQQLTPDSGRSGIHYSVRFSPDASWIVASNNNGSVFVFPNSFFAVRMKSRLSVFLIHEKGHGPMRGALDVWNVKFLTTRFL
jgi:WD40 repeat protein